MNDINNKQGEESPPETIEGIKPASTICRSISECTFVSNFWRAHTDKEWTIKEEDDTNDKDNNNTETFNTDKREDDVAGVSLETNTRLILSPQYNYNKGRRNNRNNHRNRNTRFHQDLKTDDLDGMVVMFQAKAKESTAVTLSSFPSYHSHDGTSNDNNDEEQKKEETETKDDSLAQDPDFPIVVPATSNSSTRYEIVLGANKNTATMIRRSIVVNNSDKTKRSSKTESSSLVTIPSRVCRGFGVNTNRITTEDDDNDDICWTSYWVCLSNSKLYVGMGRIPGKECFCVMEKLEEEKREQEEENPSAATENTVATPLPIRYVGIGNDTKQHNASSTEVRNLVVTNIPPCLESLLKELPSQDELPIVCLPPAASSSSMDIDEDAETLELKRYMEQYRDECLVRKRRAQKYGTQYKEQPMKDFLPWTMTKRLLLSKQLNQQTTTSSSSGFVAGDIDFLDPKEVSKREARLARFAAATAMETKTDGDGDESEAIEDGTAEMTPTLAAPITDGLAVEQAWDKESILRPVRRDPPPYLWKECPSNAETIETFKNPPDPFAMYDETTKAATWIEDKLHVSAIDWAAFKQIGNEDLLKHFGESYGPIKYIEWLGDVNCNICFGSKHSTARALVCLSNELPSPPPPGTSLAALSAAPMDKNDENNKDVSSSATASTSPTAIDLGCMNWRFGKKSIRKFSSDRRGRKGTTARYLLRMATSEDVLVERPNFWPKPPGGFSSDRVLGPKSDFANNRMSNGKSKQKQYPPKNLQKQQQAVQQQNRRGSSKSKRKRQRGENENNNTNQNKKERKNMNKNKNNSNKNCTATEGLLNRGLSSSRAGFSVEELEKERQTKKRQKTC